jgi:hypothetical protein
MSLGDVGDLANLDVASLQEYLPGVRFPTEKEQVAATAERNGPRRIWWRRSGTPAANTSTDPTRSCGRCKEAAKGTGRRSTSFGSVARTNAKGAGMDELLRRGQLVEKLYHAPLGALFEDLTLLFCSLLAAFPERLDAIRSTGRSDGDFFNRLG